MTCNRSRPITGEFCKCETLTVQSQASSHTSPVVSHSHDDNVADVDLPSTVTLYCVDGRLIKNSPLDNDNIGFETSCVSTNKCKFQK